jgi:hypothetical protein
VPPERECLAWLREARRLLTEACGPQTGKIRVVVVNERGEGIEFTLPPDQGWPAARFASVDHLTPTEVAVLAVCSAEARKAESIARAINRDCNSYLRGLLTKLVTRGHLERTLDGYRLPDARPVT